MSSAEQIISLVPTLDESTCQLVLTFINSLQGKLTEEKGSLDVSLIDKINSLIQQVQASYQSNSKIIWDYTRKQRNSL